ncbi:SAM domain-containing protein [Mycena kentingensis (nom. inval.)]|nr:SAM domain-containing protein [Mycena kentingensis (nom. inval.)]
MSLRPPSSPSPSPGPDGHKLSRQSLGPSTATRGTPALAPGSPRLASGGGARPTSELVGSAGLYQTPEAEALDQWFENLQNYEATLEDMAAASLDVNFKEELSAIEQWFKVLSEAERTAALYSLLQHSTQVQIRFFITVLQQMARSDPMTALLSPAVGGSMQQQMEAKLASLKSPGLKSTFPASPTARNFNQPGNRQSLIETNYLSPDSASLGQNPEAAAALAQRRAELKANAAHPHRMSAPLDRNTWGSGGLTQLSEANRAASPSLAEEDKSPRPKSTEFTSGGRPTGGSAPSSASAVQEATVPAHAASESWASMVTTPAMQMFAKPEPKPEPKASEWKTPGGAAVPGVPRMGDPTIHRRGARQQQQQDAGMFDDSGNFLGGNGNANANVAPNSANRMGMGMGMPGMGGMGGRPGWQSATSPASNRFGSDDGRGGAGGFNGNGMGGGMNPFAGVNMNMLAMGISPETQLLAAQMAQAQIAAAGGFAGMNGMNGMGMGVTGAPWLGGPHSAGRAGMGMGMMGGGMRGPGSARTPRSANSNASGFGGTNSSAGGGTPKSEEDPAPAHKYTPNFEGARWQDMVMMDEAALEAKGVAALGARRKMLKTFEIVRKKMGIEGGPPPLSASTPGTPNARPL